MNSVVSEEDPGTQPSGFIIDGELLGQLGY
jgi:hypothetical protein